MKNVYLLICLAGIIPFKAFSISCSQNGPDTIQTATTITGSCIINGDIIILNGGSLHVDLTGGLADTFIVRGNIYLQGNATLFINADSGSGNSQFIVSNSTNNQRNITATNTSRIILQYVEFRTQEGDLSSTGSFYMSYNALDSSALSITGCWLNPEKAWLLCNLNNTSTLIASQANELPTEVYLQDTAQMSLQGTGTTLGVWLLFESTTDTLNLPDQTGAYYSWQAGRGMGGVHASQWFLNIDSAKPGLGVQVQPFAKLVVNGTGGPVTGEAHVNLLFANGSDSVEGLNAGLQNKVVANGRLTLNNVNIGPVGWQLYAASNENLSIKNSLVNEIGIIGPANTVTVDSSILQFATLSALGTSASTLTISNSQIFSQAIIADNGSHTILNNCSVTGSWFSADVTSQITVNGGCFYQNMAGCTPNTMVNITTGQPYCNPYIPAGFPYNLTPAAVAFNGVNYNCTTSIAGFRSDNHSIKLYPNPGNGLFNIEQDYGTTITIQVLNLLNQPLLKFTMSNPQQQVDISGAAAGIYQLQISQGNDLLKVLKLVKE